MPIPEAERYLWLDEATDERVTHLVELMLSGHHFQKSDFPGGDTSFSPIREEKKTREKVCVRWTNLMINLSTAAIYALVNLLQL